MLCSANVEKDKLFVTGPIQMDFLRKELKGWYMSREELFHIYKIDISKECVLFTSSFVSSSWDKPSLEWLYSQFDEEEREYSKSSLSREIESRDTITKWLIALARTKDCTVIYRPHPAEVKSVAIEAFKDYDNIKVIGDYNIKQWILACDQVYTWNSTSLTEASVAGIPCAVLRPVSFEKRNEYPIYEGIPYITTYQQFEDYYDNKLQNNSTERFVSKDKLGCYLSIDPCVPSYIRTANILEQSLNDKYFFPWSNFRDDEFQNIGKWIKKQIRQDVLVKLIVKPVSQNKMFMKLLKKIFPQICYRYYELMESKPKIVLESEFVSAENRIEAIIEHNNKVN